MTTAQQVWTKKWILSKTQMNPFYYKTFICAKDKDKEKMEKHSKLNKFWNTKHVYMLFSFPCDLQNNYRRKNKKHFIPEMFTVWWRLIVDLIFWHTRITNLVAMNYLLDFAELKVENRLRSHLLYISCQCHL